MSDATATAATFGPGTLGATFSGPFAATFGGEPTTPTPLAEPLPATFGPSGLGATFGPNVTGALYSNQQTVGQLLSGVDGFGLVVEPVPKPHHTDERLLFTTSGNERDADGAFLSLSVVREALAVASLDVDFVADARLFRFPLARFALAFDGHRILSGRFENPDADSGSQQGTLTGFGMLDTLRSGGIEVSYAAIPVWQAIQDFYENIVIPRSDGLIRGSTVPPNVARGEREAMIPPEGLELSGTPLSVLAELHGYGGYVWSTEYDDLGYGCQMESFLPGTQLRDALWEIEQGGASPELDIGDYHTDVIVHGAKKPGVGEAAASNRSRYYGKASVSDEEARTVTGGERIVFETTKNSLESNAACETWAKSKLDELRGSYALSGDLEVVWSVAGDLVPGHTYRIPEFDSAAPAILSPAVLPLRSVQYQYGSATADVSLSFGQLDGGAIGTIAGRDDPPLVLRGLNRLDGVNFNGQTNTRQAWASGYPHAYPSTSPQA